MDKFKFFTQADCRLRLFLLVLASFLPISLNSHSAVLPDLSLITGAEIDESTIEVKIFVYQEEGSDDNSGLVSDKPLKTLESALNKAREFLDQGLPTKIILAPGVYRESARMEFIDSIAAETLLIIEGSQRSGVILEGSDVFLGQNWEDLGGNLYRHEWPYQFGHYFLNNANNVLVAQRAEMLWVNGRPLKPIILENYDYINDHSLPRPERYKYIGFEDPREALQPGTFGVAEREENGSWLYLKLPPATSMNDALVEAGVRPTLLFLGNKSNLVLRNLTFQRASNLLNSSPLQLGNRQGRRLWTGDPMSATEWEKWFSLEQHSWSGEVDDFEQPGHTGGERVTRIPVFKGKSSTNSFLTRNFDVESDDLVFETRVRILEGEGEAGIGFSLEQSKGVPTHLLTISGEELGLAKLYEVGPEGWSLMGSARFIQEPGEYTWIQIKIIDGKAAFSANNRQLFSLSTQSKSESPSSPQFSLAVKNSRTNFADIQLTEWRPAPSNILIENSHFRWNSSQGLSLWNMRQVTIRDSSFSFNGYHGINAGRIDNMIMEDNETNFNNWRGHWGGWLGRFVGATKWHWTDNQLVRRHISFGNYTYGFWHDIHCHNIVLEEMVSVLNLGYGVFFEISEGPFLLDKSLLAANGRYSLHNAMVTDVTVSNSILASFDGLAPIDYLWYARRDPHWAEKPLVANGYTVKDSVIYAPGAELVHTFRMNVSQSDYRFLPAAQAYKGSENNIYFGLNRDSAFQVFDKTTSSGQRHTDLRGYHQFAGNNTARWIDPGFVDPEGFDFRAAEWSLIREREEDLPFQRIPSSLIEQADEFFEWVGTSINGLPTRERVRGVRAMDLGGISSRLIQLESPTEGATIRYTTDGSEVTEMSPLYTGELFIDRPTTLRFKAFKEGLITSRESSFIVDWDPVAAEGELLAGQATFVRGGNYGTQIYDRPPAIQLKVTRAPDFNRESFFLFDMRLLPQTFSKVTLRLYCIRDEGGYNTLWKTNMSSEINWEAMNWHNKPEMTEKIARWDVPSGGGFVEIDITEYVKEFRGDYLTLGLQGSYEAWTHYSGLNSGNRSPRLIVSK